MSLGRAPRLTALAWSIVLLGACTYDYSGIPRTDTPAIDGGGPGADAGSMVRCDPLAGTGCMTTLSCSASLDASRELTARCTTLGAAGEGAGCAGPGVCAAGLLCLHAAGGSGSCAAFCTDTTACPAARECDRTAALFAVGSRVAYRCR